jgi:hypothetical protein
VGIDAKAVAGDPKLIGSGVKWNNNFGLFLPASSGGFRAIRLERAAIMLSIATKIRTFDQFFQFFVDNILLPSNRYF